MDRGGARHGVDPHLPKARHIWDWNQTISSGWMEIELEMELTPNQLKLGRGGARHGVDPSSFKMRHIWTGIRDGVNPQKVEYKYECGDGSRDGVDPPNPISSGWTEVEPDMELTPLHLR